MKKEIEGRNSLEEIKDQVKKKPESDIKKKILKDIEEKSKHETIQK